MIINNNEIYRRTLCFCETEAIYVLWLTKLIQMRRLRSIVPVIKKDLSLYMIWLD